MSFPLSLWSCGREEVQEKCALHDEMMREPKLIPLPALRSYPNYISYYFTTDSHCYDSVWEERHSSHIIVKTASVGAEWALAWCRADLWTEWVNIRATCHMLSAQCNVSLRIQQNAAGAGMDRGFRPAAGPFWHTDSMLTVNNVLTGRGNNN